MTMTDAKGNAWTTEPVDPLIAPYCTSLAHTITNRKKPATYREILTTPSGNVRVEYTCWTCHMIMLGTAKRLVNVR